MPDGGAIVAIWRDGALHAAAAGAQPDGASVPADGAWRIGSVTKPFMAAIVLQLVEQGVIDLDAPAARYLPTPPVPESVTVRDLLGHTSGIFNYTDDISFFPETFADLERRWQPEDLVAQAIELREVPAEPGWAYSNTNYLVLGLIIEQVTGRPAEEAIAALATEHGLTSTYLAGSGAGPEPVAAFTHFPGSETAVDAGFDYTSTATGAWTAGAMVSDATDLLGFFRSLFAGEVVGADALASMTATGNQGYGLGIARIPGTRSEVFGHDGGIIGYTTHVAYAPEVDAGIVVGVTSDLPPPGYQRLLDRLLIEVLAG
jgi:D-alanyl-D-alanine carboxypeptidase